MKLRWTCPQPPRRTFRFRWRPDPDYIFIIDFGYSRFLLERRCAS